jgi:hypothetical protein
MVRYYSSHDKGNDGGIFTRVYSKSKLVSQGIQNHSQKRWRNSWVDGWGNIFDDEANELSMIE